MAFITIYDKTGHPWEISDNWWWKYQAQGYTKTPPSKSQYQAHQEQAAQDAAKVAYQTGSGGTGIDALLSKYSSLLPEIKRKAESNIALESPTTDTQTLWQYYRNQVIQELTRKADVGQPPENDANQSTWMAILANMSANQQPGAISNTTAAIKNMTGAHPGLALGIGGLVLLLLLRR